MKLAFFVTQYPVPSETFVTDQIAAMVARGHDVTIITAKRREGVLDPRLETATLVALQPVDVHRSRAIPRLAMRALRNRYDLRKAAVAARAIVQRLPGSALDLAAHTDDALGRFDAIICHFGTAGVRAEALRRAGVFSGPICTFFHGYDVSKLSTVKRYLPHYRRLFRQTELMLPVSHLWRRRLVEWGAGSDRVIVQRMGVDFERIAAQAFDKPIGRPLRVLSVARLIEKKGIKFAIAGVRQAGIPIEYTVIGTGSDEEALRIQAAGSKNEIRFLGRQPHSAVLAELVRSDVFLLPSVTATDGDMEGVPVALMEAMATGVLTVATRHSANNELIADGEEGLLVDEGDAGAIATALEKIGSGEIDVFSIRRAAREKVAREFDNAKLNEQLEQVLAQLTTSKRGNRKDLASANGSSKPFEGGELL